MPVRQTSLISYKMIIETGKTSRMQRKIMEVLALFPVGLTDLELMSKLGYHDPNKIRPRRNELVKKDLVINNGKRQDSINNMYSNIWIINTNNNKIEKERCV